MTMEVPVFNTQGQEVSRVDLPANIFEVEVNTALMHQAYVRQLSNARQNNAHTKTRSEISRTTAKWYRQKGTGRARHGSRNAPIFVGGGQAHGPRNTRNYTLAMPKKMRRAALRSALSALLRDQQIVVVEDIKPSEAKTKAMQAYLSAVAGTQNALVLYTPAQQDEVRYIRNLEQATALHVGYLNIRDLLSHEKLVLSLAALDHIKSHLG
jgi:large subunit ribosomal protein L4